MDIKKHKFCNNLLVFNITLNNI